MNTEERNLLNACIKNDLILIKTLIEDEGENPNQRFELGATALMIATQEQNKEIVEYLLSKGADPNIKAENNVSPLMIAAASGNTEIAKILVANGAETAYSEKDSNKN